MHPAHTHAPARRRTGRTLLTTALATALTVPLLATVVPTVANATGTPASAAASAVTPSEVGFLSDGARPRDDNYPSFRTSPIELGLRFSSSVAGVVTGVEFYKGSRNTGTHVGILADDAGKTLATVTFRNETSHGWQYAAFAKPVAIAAGKTYRVSYTSPRGRYALTESYYARARTSGPLRAPANAAFHKYSWDKTYKTADRGENYWVDVRFRPAATTPAPTPTPAPTTTPTPSPTPTATPTQTVTPVPKPSLPPTSPSPTTPPPTTSPTPTAPPSTSGSRDRYQWPFASNSIWNMPVGSGAQYLPMKLTPPAQGYSTDEVYLTFDPSAPLQPLVDRGYWWPWTSGTSVTGKNTGHSVRVPNNWIVAPPSRSSQPNNGSAALQADGLAREFQYTVRPTSGSAISIFEGVRASYDLAGNGLTGSNGFGAHGGSGMTAIGGTLRAGELSGPEPIRHALAVTMNMKKYGAKSGNGLTNGYRWPAIAADSYYAGSGGYGSLGPSQAGLGMGSLIALPASVNIDSLGLETPQGKKLAWTYQNYGAYVVDDSFDPGSWDTHRLNVEIGVLKEFPAIDTYPGTNSPFGRDMNKVFTRLAVVSNNGPSSIGGGGTPRQPLAPPLR